MSRPAQCVHRIRYQVPRLQACFNHCPSPSDHGCISHWIWSRDSLHDQITPPSSLSLMVFPRQPTLWRCLNCPLRWKPLCSSPSMFSALMEFLRGPWFTSQVWKKLCSELGAQVSLSSGFHPQTNGQVERANQELEAMLRCVASSNQSTWSDRHGSPQKRPSSELQSKIRDWMIAATLQPRPTTSAKRCGSPPGTFH